MLENTKTAIKEKRRARGRPKTGDLAELEARLIRVARQHFIANGFGATSMNEIANAARVSKGTLYARFPTKADLFRAVIDNEITHTSVVTRPIRPQARTLEAILRIFIERALRFSLSDEVIQLNRLVYSESERFPELGHAVLSRSSTGMEHIAAIIRDFEIAEGMPCQDPDGAAEMLVTLIRGFYADVMQRAEAATLAEIKNWTRKTLR
jgi:AcrR family transcriptional regulator